MTQTLRITHLRVDAGKGHVAKPGSRGGHIIGYRHGEPVYGGIHPKELHRYASAGSMRPGKELRAAGYSQEQIEALAPVVGGMKSKRVAREARSRNTDPLYPGHVQNKLFFERLKRERENRANEQKAELNARFTHYENLADRQKWSKSDLDNVKRYVSAGVGGVPAAVNRALYNSIRRAARKAGWSVEHRSASGSTYITIPEKGMVRVSDHELPATPSRDFSLQPWKGEVILEDYHSAALPEIMSAIENSLER